MAVDHETLVAMLDRLKLTAIRDQLDTLLDEAARSEMTLREALAFFVGREIARRDERRIQMASKIAQFPFRARPGWLRVQCAALGGSRPDPGAGDVPVDRAWRSDAVPGTARNGESPPGGGTGARGDPAELLYPVRRRRCPSSTTSPPAEPGLL